MPGGRSNSNSEPCGPTVRNTDGLSPEPLYERGTLEVIVTHPQVLEAAVFGIPHDKWGEAPLAAVVLKANATLDAATLKAWVNERVSARYQQVCEIVVRAEFPRNAAGKTLKRLMRDEYWKDTGGKI